MMLRSRGLPQTEMTETTQNADMTPDVPRPETTHAGTSTATTMTPERLFGVQESAVEQMARTLTQAIQNAIRPQESRSNILPTFTGLGHEDPVIFITKLREGLRRQGIVNEEESVNVGLNQLRGEVANWLAPYAPYIRTFEELENKILAKYDDPATNSRLHSKLYGEIQRENESVSLFIMKKRALYTRLAPRTPDSAIIPLIMELIRPAIRAHLRVKTFYSIEEFDGAASRVQRDLSCQNLPARRIPENRVEQNPARPPPSQPGPSRAPSAQNPAPAQRPSERQNNDRPNIPPNPCRFCGEWHYHSQCPRNPFKRATENTVRAGGNAPRRPATPPAPGQQ